MLVAPEPVREHDEAAEEVLRRRPFRERRALGREGERKPGPDPPDELRDAFEGVQAAPAAPPGLLVSSAHPLGAPMVGDGRHEQSEGGLSPAAPGHEVFEGQRLAEAVALRVRGVTKQREDLRHVPAREGREAQGLVLEADGELPDVVEGRQRRQTFNLDGLELAQPGNGGEARAEQRLPQERLAAGCHIGGVGGEGVPRSHRAILVRVELPPEAGRRSPHDRSPPAPTPTGAPCSARKSRSALRCRSEPGRRPRRACG